MPDPCDPMDCSPPGSSVHVIFLGKNTGVGCNFFFQGIFPTQGSNPYRLRCSLCVFNFLNLRSAERLTWLPLLPPLLQALRRAKSHSDPDVPVPLNWQILNNLTGCLLTYTLGSISSGICFMVNLLSQDSSVSTVSCVIPSSSLHFRKFFPQQSVPSNFKVYVHSHI